MRFSKVNKQQRTGNNGVLLLLLWMPFYFSVKCDMIILETDKHALLQQFRKCEFVGVIGNSSHILPIGDLFFVSDEIYFCHKQQVEAIKMDQQLTGKFIAHKRKEKNLTQEQLAEKLGVSNKTISKWETGKCMPDYSVVKTLCDELEITVAELMDGEDAEKKSVRAYDDEQIMDLLKRTQELEKQKNLLYGIILIVMGIALQALSHTLGGSNVKDFFSGVLLGISIAEMLAGIFVVGKSMAGR